MRLAGESWNFTESGKVFGPCVGDVSRTVFGGESSNVVQNNATILRFVRITVRQDEILPSERKTYSLTV
jgi:hypothetical protein